jgi:hypothetical protein
LTRELIDNGIAIHFDDSIDLVPKDFFRRKHFGYYYSCTCYIQSGIILWRRIILRKELRS